MGAVDVGTDTSNAGYLSNESCPSKTHSSLFEPTDRTARLPTALNGPVSRARNTMLSAPWIADMDLPTSDKIIDAIKDRLDERVFRLQRAARPVL